LFGAAQKAIIRDSIHAPHMTGYLFIVIGAVLVNNVVFGRVLGLCPFMGVSKKLETALGMGAATTFVLTVAAGASYLIDRYLLVPNGLEYLRTLSFIIVIAGLVQLTEMVDPEDQPAAAPGARHLPAAHHHQLRGARRAAAQRRLPLQLLLESLLFGFGSALGFSLALVLFGSLRERLEGADVPLPFAARPSP
jgi:electron transport complex protein RnfA